MPSLRVLRRHECAARALAPDFRFRGAGTLSVAAFGMYLARTAGDFAPSTKYGNFPLSQVLLLRTRSAALSKKYLHGNAIGRKKKVNTIRSEEQTTEHQS